MKTLKMIVGLFFMVLVMNCKDNTNSGAADNATYPQTATDRTNQSTTSDYNESNRTRENINDADSLNNATESGRNNGVGNSANVNAADNNRMNKMFADLNFTSEQIERYNTMSQTDMDNWRKNNPNGQISSEQHRQMEDERMKSFLNSAQYQQYQQWVKDNPVKNQR